MLFKYFNFLKIVMIFHIKKFRENEKEKRFNLGVEFDSSQSFYKISTIDLNFYILKI